ncbi:MAG: Hsp20/alpha crystallin family protein [Candidatus Altiarchaeota archaeon]
MSGEDKKSGNASDGDILEDALGDDSPSTSPDALTEGQDKVPKDFRRMVEDITVTPFFDRHGSHMPATIKLHAELREDGDFIHFETRIPGFREDDVKVEVGVNTINVSLLMDKTGEGGEEDVYFHNSFTTPRPIDVDNVFYEHKDGILRIRAPIRK